MPCDHVGAPELIAMAEEHLRATNVPLEAWAGRRFRYSENVENGYWASVITEIERRSDGWVVTRLDRSREQIETAGFEPLTPV